MWSWGDEGTWGRIICMEAAEFADLEAENLVEVHDFANPSLLIVSISQNRNSSQKFRGLP